MQKEASPRQSAIKTLPEIHVVDQDPKVLLQSNGLRNSATLQPDETVDHFLKRLPVADPETANTGPWLWVHDRDRNKHHDRSDTDSFKDQGEALLNAFVKQRSTIEAQHPGMAPAGITRKMAPYRDQLVDDLRSAAVDSGVTCGKWMLFPKSADLPRCWRIVAEATSHGKLGPTSKVGTYDPYDTKDETLICVYTHDFTDVEDVRRVLDELLALNLCRSEGKRIYYKCDA